MTTARECTEQTIEPTTTTAETRTALTIITSDDPAGQRDTTVNRQQDDEMGFQGQIQLGVADTQKTAAEMEYLESPEAMIHRMDEEEDHHPIDTHVFPPLPPDHHDHNGRNILSETKNHHVLPSTPLASHVNDLTMDDLSLKKDTAQMSTPLPPVSNISTATTMTNTTTKRSKSAKKASSSHKKVPPPPWSLKLDPKTNRLTLKQGKALSLPTHPTSIMLMSRHYQLLSSATLPTLEDILNIPSESNVSDIDIVPESTSSLHAMDMVVYDAKVSLEPPIVLLPSATVLYTLTPEQSNILHSLIAIHAQESGVLEEKRLVHSIQNALVPKDNNRPAPIQKAYEAEIKRALPRIMERVNYGAGETADLAIRRWEVRETFQTLFPPELLPNILERQKERCQARQQANLIVGGGESIPSPGNVVSTPGTGENSPVSKLEDKENALDPSLSLTTPAKSKSPLLQTPAPLGDVEILNERISGEITLLSSQSKRAHKKSSAPGSASAQREGKGEATTSAKNATKAAGKKVKMLEVGQKSIFGFFSKKVSTPSPDQQPMLMDVNGEKERSRHKDYYSTFLPFVKRENTVVSSLYLLTHRIPKPLDFAINQNAAMDDAEFETCRRPLMAGFPKRTDLGALQRKKKFIYFHTDIRPPFVGLFLPHLIPRRRAYRNPFAQIPELDYSVDSELEWEDETGSIGEELLSDDDERSIEGEVEDDDGDEDDGFLVPHGYLSDDEGDGERVVLQGAAASTTAQASSGIRGPTKVLPPIVFNNLVERASTPHDIYLFLGRKQISMEEIMGNQPIAPPSAPKVFSSSVKKSNATAKKPASVSPVTSVPKNNVPVAKDHLTSNPDAVSSAPIKEKKASQPKSISSELLPALNLFIQDPANGAMNRGQLVGRVVEAFAINHLTKSSVDAYIRTRFKRLTMPMNGGGACKLWSEVTVSQGVSQSVVQSGVVPEKGGAKKGELS